jgi:polygalacturonase
MARRIENLAVLIFMAMVLATLTSTAALPADSENQLANINPALPQIPQRTFNVKDFGAVGDGKTFDTQALQNAIDKVKSAGGGRLIVPAGTYLTLPITLCSQIDLHLEKDAVLQAPATFTDYGLPEPETLESQKEVSQKVKMPPPFISGRHLHDVAISGEGAIDGAGAIWWAWSERAARSQPGRLIYPRPKMVVIDGCQRLHISGVTLRNSPKFHFVPAHVSDLLIENVTVQSPSDAPNTDAIDPSNCNNVLIRNCTIDTGDDDIVIKSGGSDILIQDCTILHGHGISIGSGTTDGIHDMLVRRCSFDGADNGIRIKSMRGAGGLVERIFYKDITMKNVGNAIVLDLLYTDNNRPNFQGEAGKIPQIKNILLENIDIESAINAGKIVGLPESPISDVTLRNVSITADNDLVLTNTEDIHQENVTRNIKNAAQ